MDFNPESFAAVRSYVFDYIAGVLWLLALGITIGSAENLRALWAILNAVSSSEPAMRLPSIVINFLLAIGGTVLPYSAGIAARPLALGVMNRVVPLQRWAGRYVRRKLRKYDRESERDSLRSAAIDAAQRKLGLKDNVTRQMRSVILRVAHPGVAAQIERTKDEVMFYASTVLPSAFLFGALAYRFSPVHQFTVGISVGGLSFVAGTLDARSKLDHYEDCLNTGILLTPPDEPPA